MKFGACVAFALAAAAAQEPDSARERTPPKPVEGPGPRVRIADQNAIHAVSRVIYTGRPDDPHDLATTLAFPERVRTELSRAGGRASERRLAYRFGATLWTLATDSDRSEEVGEAEREFVLLELELRRALLLWPDGCEWSAPEAGSSRARIALPEGRATLVATGIEAHAGGAAPARLAVVDDEGAERLRYDRLTWARDQGRLHPRSLRFVIGETFVWTEEFRLVDRRARFADVWFRPPDRRETPGETVNPLVHALDLRPGLVRRSALDAETDWPAALARAGALLAETEAPPGHRLSRDLRVELDPRGRPTSVSTWSEPSGEPRSETPPAGWERFPGGPALGRWLPDPTAPRPGAIAELLRRAKLAEGTEPRLLLQVADREDGTRRARLLLLLPGEPR